MALDFMGGPGGGGGFTTLFKVLLLAGRLLPWEIHGKKRGRQIY